MVLSRNEVARLLDAMTGTPCEDVRTAMISSRVLLSNRQGVWRPLDRGVLWGIVRNGFGERGYSYRTLISG